MAFFSSLSGLVSSGPTQIGSLFGGSSGGSRVSSLIPTEYAIVADSTPLPSLNSGSIFGGLGGLGSGLGSGPMSSIIGPFGTLPTAPKATPTPAATTPSGTSTVPPSGSRSIGTDGLGGTLLQLTRLTGESTAVLNPLLAGLDGNTIVWGAIIAGGLYVANTII